MNTPKPSLLETLRSKLIFGQSRLNSACLRFCSDIARAKHAVQCWHARQWQRIYGTHYRFSFWKARYGSAVTTVFLILLMVASGYLAPTLQGVLESYFSTEERLAGLRTLLVTLGGSLLGAAAIVFSLVMFAMQVNLERMPYGLFRKFGSDPQLLGAFAATFLLAIGVAALSLISDRSWLAVAILAGSWGTILILVLFLYAYRRALSLISPTQQLKLIFKDARGDLRAWVRRARRATPLFERSDRHNMEQGSPLRSTHDLPRVAYFQLNPHWTAGAQRAILHSISFARRYAEQGDREVSRAALGAVVAINAAYVEAKGKTFFTNPLLFDNPLARDGFITETLEHLRQYVQVGISRGDEQQIEQALGALAALSRIFLDIDYASEHASKTHAHLAAEYLARAVHSVVPRNMPDVLMEGVRLMGEVAQLMLRHEPSAIVTITGHIALIACAGVAKEDYRPVMQVGMDQLARLTFELIRSKSSDIQFTARRIRGNVTSVAKLFLSLPDTPLSSIHSAFLAPYYSVTSPDTLLGWLTELVNAVASAKADDEVAQRVVRNIVQWADGLYETEKEIFLAALKMRSHFAFDIVHWITQVTTLLLAVSNAPACGDHARDELRNSALWLISVLSWVPDGEQEVAFVETVQMTEALFDAAMDASSRNCSEVAEKTLNLLFSWAFKAGKYETGWAILEQVCYGLAVLELVRDKDGSALVAKISEQLKKEKSPSQEIRARLGRNIRERASVSYPDLYSLSRIEYGMGQVDQRKLRPLLEEIANRLSPETASEPIHRRTA